MNHVHQRADERGVETGHGRFEQAGDDGQFDDLGEERVPGR